MKSKNKEKQYKKQLIMETEARDSSFKIGINKFKKIKSIWFITSLFYAVVGTILSTFLGSMELIQAAVMALIATLIALWGTSNGFKLLSFIPLLGGLIDLYRLIDSMSEFMKNSTLIDIYIVVFGIFVVVNLYSSFSFLFDKHISKYCDEMKLISYKVSQNSYLWK